MSEMKEIMLEQLQAKIEAEEEIYVIDVREDYEVVNGMIPNAIHIPMNEIPNHLAKFDTDREYTIVCAGGVRSERVCHYLMEHDIKVVNLVGGMNSWTGEVR